MGDIGSGIGGKYSHRVWQQFWIQKPTSEKSEIFTKILGPWARGPLGPWTLGPRCACAANRRSPASRRKVRCQGPLGRSGGRCHRPELRPASPVNMSLRCLFSLIWDSSRIPLHTCLGGFQFIVIQSDFITNLIRMSFQCDDGDECPFALD